MSTFSDSRRPVTKPEPGPSTVRDDESNTAAQTPAAGTAPATIKRVSTLMGVEVTAIGAYAAPDVVRNEDLATLGYDADWILQRTGIRERRRVAAGQATSDLAYEAARQCLERAGTRAEELDLILVATMTPDAPMPSTACYVQRRLGGTAAAWDINAACAGFMFALVSGMQFIKTDTARRVLVIGGDVMSSTVSPSDRKTFPLFGDAAGAVLLGAGGENQGLLAYTIACDGSGTELLCQPGGGTREPLTPDGLAAGRQYMRMEGRAVFKWAVRVVVDSVIDVLAHSGLTPGDIDLAVFHQANIRIIDAAAEDLGIPRDRVVVNLDRYGNSSAGSIPLALEEARAQGRIHRGDRILFSGFGAGLAWCTGIYQW